MDSGEYERIFEYDDTLEGAKLEKYLSHHLLQLRFERGQDTDYFIPKISASGN